MDNAECFTKRILQFSCLLSGPRHCTIVLFSIRITSRAIFIVHPNTIARGWHIFDRRIDTSQQAASRSHAHLARTLLGSERGVSPAACNHDNNFLVWICVAGALLGWFRASCAVDWYLPFICLGCVRGADSHGSASVGWQDCID